MPGANKALTGLGFQDEADPGLAKMNLDYDPTRTDSREYGLTMMENTKELERKLDDQQRAGGSFWQEEK